MNGPRLHLLLLLPLLLLAMLMIPMSCRHSTERPDIEILISIDHLYSAADGPLYLRLDYHWDPGPQFRMTFDNPKVFVHLLDREKVIVAQDDHSPEPSILSWQPGNPISYQRLFLLPRMRLEGMAMPLNIRVGLYESESPDQKILLEDFHLEPEKTTGQPSLVALEGERIEPVPEGWTRRRLAPRLPSADYRKTGGSSAENVRLVSREQVTLARDTQEGDSNSPPLAILTPAGTAAEFALMIPPNTRLVTTARTRTEGTIRVSLQKYGGREKDLCEKSISGSSGRMEFQLSTSVSRPAWIRMEASGGEDVLWIEPALETRAPRASRMREPLEALQRLKQNAEQWNVLLVIQDAARADELSCYGNLRRTSPALDRLSRQSVVATRATSNAPYTLSSTASLFTGLYPTSHQVISLEDRLPAHLPHLTESFQKMGFSTAAVSASPFTTRTYGMDRGFDYYLGNFKRGQLFTGPEVVRSVDLLHPYLAPGEEGRNYFLYTHFLEPHSPYTPPEPFHGWFSDQPGPEGADGSLKTLQALDRGTLEPTPERMAQVEALYQENLMYGDLQLAKLLASLRKEGLLEHTLVIVTSDHGEAFNEHGRLLHNSTVYQEMIHIPLVLSFPNGGPAPRRYHQPLETVDLTALLQDLFLEKDWHSELTPEGTSFLPQLVGVPPDPKDLGLVLGSHGESFGLTSGRFKLIMDQKGLQFFHLSQDPGERNSLPWKGRLPEAVTRQALLHQLIHRPPTTEEAEQVPAGNLPSSDELTYDQLRALGYIE